MNRYRKADIKEVLCYLHKWSQIFHHTNELKKIQLIFSRSTKWFLSNSWLRLLDTCKECIFCFENTSIWLLPCYWDHSLVDMVARGRYSWLVWAEYQRSLSVRASIPDWRYVTLLPTQVENRTNIRQIWVVTSCAWMKTGWEDNSEVVLLYSKNSNPTCDWNNYGLVYACKWILQGTDLQKTIKDMDEKIRIGKQTIREERINYDIKKGDLESKLTALKVQCLPNSGDRYEEARQHLLIFNSLGFQIQSGHSFWRLVQKFFLGI